MELIRTGLSVSRRDRMRLAVDQAGRAQGQASQ
jgi:hypothetical protein